jgi:hypothetical protein
MTEQGDEECGAERALSKRRHRMKYMLLIYSNEADVPKQGTREFDELIGAFSAFSDQVKTKGLFVDGAGLQPVATATTVRVRDGKTATTDGPYAETKEQLGGFYLLECKDLDEALEYAARIPTVRRGAVEVRPVAVMG